MEKGGATSGKSRSNRWKQDEQQVENGIAIGGNGNSATSGLSQPDGIVQPESQRAR